MVVFVSYLKGKGERGGRRDGDGDTDGLSVCLDVVHVVYVCHCSVTSSLITSVE